ncbi:phospholipid phosphatase-related protein type 5 [Arvicola amphibius]|uniref:phospholipid phosphatase-related protein type 5 n=1 Tax=Arvicola amphibius TaxID=1047088 RepID=UPI001C08C918|nr:phospholipid phosphatase-related protein type 5 [Arvicola amphibius]
MPLLPAAFISSMLYFQMVIMAGTVMLAYYFEYTDTFTVNVQGFFCHDSSYRKPYPGPEDSSAVPPVLLYSLAAGVPVLVIIVGETAVFCLQLATRDFENQEKTILTGDCCYINPLVRRTVRFLGIYTFGLFATDIFVNAGQVVTGNLAPHFLALCKPNYTALGCQQYTQFISGEEACTGNPDLIMRARKTFPSKEAALSVYAAMYLTMYITNTIKAKGTRLAKPVLCLGLMCLAFLTGLNRVAEYRNHWSDVIAGFLVGISIAVFLVVCVVNNFKGRQPENGHMHRESVARMPMINIPRVESPLEKVASVQILFETAGPGLSGCPCEQEVKCFPKIALATSVNQIGSKSRNNGLTNGQEVLALGVNQLCWQFFAREEKESACSISGAASVAHAASWSLGAQDAVTIVDPFFTAEAESSVWLSGTILAWAFAAFPVASLAFQSLTSLLSTLHHSLPPRSLCSQVLT